MHAYKGKSAGAQEARKYSPVDGLSSEERAQLEKFLEPIWRNISSGIKQCLDVNRLAPRDFEPFVPDMERVIRGSEQLAPLLAQRQWVVWKWEVKNGNLTKPPYRASDPSKFADSSDKATWDTFEAAVANVHRAAGIRFALGEGFICALDLDDCRNPETGAVAPWAIALMDQCKSYVEITPIGTGFRIIGYGKGERVQQKISTHKRLDGLSKDGTLEIYRQANRYFQSIGFGRRMDRKGRRHML